MRSRDPAAAIFATQDCRAAFATLKARRVEFRQEPMDREYGVDAAFRDPFGNSGPMTERA